MQTRENWPCPNNEDPSICLMTTSRSLYTPKWVEVLHSGRRFLPRDLIILQHDLTDFGLAQWFCLLKKPFKKICNAQWLCPYG